MTKATCTSEYIRQRMFFIDKKNVYSKPSIAKDLTKMYVDLLKNHDVDISVRVLIKIVSADLYKYQDIKTWDLNYDINEAIKEYESICRQIEEKKYKIIYKPSSSGLVYEGKIEFELIEPKKI